MIRQVGIRRFWTGLVRAIQSTTFFPVLADIRKHLPDAESLNEYKGPSPEDLKRKSVGERSYGRADIQELWKMFDKYRAILGRPTTEKERRELLDKLDRRIDKIFGIMPSTGGKK